MASTKISKRDSKDTKDKKPSPPTSETCLICNDPLQPSDTKYPLICETRACTFNMCLSCTSNLLSTSNQGLQEGSDGNRYYIELQCPSCRGAFEVSLNHVLALRGGELQENLKDVPDVELNARDLRRKHDVSDDKLTLLSEARKTYNIVKSKQSTGTKGGIDKADIEMPEPLNGGISDGGKLSEEQNNDSESNNHANRIKNKIEFVDNMLFQGLEGCMSGAERNFVMQLMTSGSTDKLVMAAQLFEKIVAMNAVPKEPSEQRNEKRPSSPLSISSGQVATHANSQDSSPKAAESDTYAPSYRTKRKRPQQNALSASAAAFPTTLDHSQTEFQLEAAQRREWSAMYPLPFRMPRAFLLPLDFDPYDRKSSPVRFLDDEVTLSFLHDQKYSKINYEDRCNIVRDAFSTLSVSMWRQVVKRDNSHFLGAENILLGLEHDAEERQAPDEKVPWRRVVVSYVHRSLSRTAGLKVGDVVTHLDGEVFDGNTEKLKFLLEVARKNEVTLGDEMPNVEIVVNAEVSVAEVLRLRSFMARNQPYD